MNPVEILNAIDGSIEKWKKIRYEDGLDEGRENCPLCQIFNNFDEYDEPEFISCEGCPISEYIHDGECLSTPYEKWSYHQHNDHGILGTTSNIFEMPDETLCKECQKIAEDEIAFLETVRAWYVSTYI